MTGKTKAEVQYKAQSIKDVFAILFYHTFSSSMVSFITPLKDIFSESSCHCIALSGLELAT